MSCSIFSLSQIRENGVTGRWNQFHATTDVSSKYARVPPCGLTPKELGFNRDERKINPLPRIAFVANDWDRKGGLRLLKWHQTHWSDLAELHVFSNKVQRDDQARNVVWHGGVSNRSLVCEFLQIMDMLGIVLIEVAMAGLPVVCSRMEVQVSSCSQSMNQLL